MSHPEFQLRGIIRLLIVNGIGVLIVAAGGPRLSAIYADEAPKPIVAGKDSPAKLIRLDSSSCDRAIGKAVSFLNLAQRNEAWDEIPKGATEPPTLRRTALAALALSEVFAYDRPSNRDAVTDRLRRAHPDTFTASLLTQFAKWRWSDKFKVGVDLSGVAKGRATHAGPLFGPEVSDPKGANWADTYWAIRGISAQVEDNVPVPTDFWKQAGNSLALAQVADGSFADTGENSRPATYMATVAALLSLDIAASYVPIDSDQDGNTYKHVSMGTEYLQRHAADVMDALENGSDARPCETVWWLNEVLQATGEKDLGKRVSAEKLASILLNSQENDGSWRHDVEQTAWAIRCLNKCLAPVPMGKLKYGPGNHWNRRPGDLEHFSANFSSDLCGRTLRWRIVDVDGPVNDMCAAAVLLVTGGGPLEFTDAEKAKLKEYVARGGLLLGNADKANPEFCKSFINLGKDLFPKYEFRDLPESHLIFTNEMFMGKKWRSIPVFHSISNGVRELMILIPTADPSLAWQPGYRRSNRDKFEFVSNILIYSYRDGLWGDVDREMANLPAIPESRKELSVAMIAAGENWNPEPNAWRRMAWIAANSLDVKLRLAQVSLGKGDLKGYSLAHFTGTGKLALSPADRAEIKAFVDAGGTLLVDAAGGSSVFADSANDELKAVFGDEAAQLQEPLSSQELSKSLQPIEKFEYRIYARRVLDNTHIPRLRAIRRNGRLAVIFSREDLTAGMASVEADGIVGYDVATATAIVRGILKSLRDRI